MKRALIILLAGVAAAVVILLFMPSKNKRIKVETPKKPKISVPELPKERPNPKAIANIKNPFQPTEAQNARQYGPGSPMAVVPREPEKLPEYIRKNCDKIKAKLLQSKISFAFVKNFVRSPEGKHKYIHYGFSKYFACEGVKRHDISLCQELGKITDMLEKRCVLEWLFFEMLAYRYYVKREPAEKIIKELNTKYAMYPFIDVITWVLKDTEKLKRAQNADEVCAKPEPDNEIHKPICYAIATLDTSYCMQLENKQGKIMCSAMIEFAKHLKDNDWTEFKSHENWPLLLRMLPELLGVKKGEASCKEVLLDWIDYSCKYGEPYYN